MRFSEYVAESGASREDLPGGPDGGAAPEDLPLLRCLREIRPMEWTHRGWHALAMTVAVACLARRGPTCKACEQMLMTRALRRT